LIPFLPFYILISLSLTQSSWAIVISAIFFVILGFLCIFFLVKRTAKKIAKYLEKCDEMNQEPTVYDLLYKFN
jgi:Na+/phosphate symporter